MLNKIQKLISDINSDSKSKSDKAEGKLVELGIDHLHKLMKINSKYDYKYSEHSEYQIGRGYCYFDNVNTEHLHIKYTDSWSYGGHCEEYIPIKLSELIDFDYIAYELKTKKKRISKINSKIKNNENSIKSLKLELKKFEK